MFGVEGSGFRIERVRVAALGYARFLHLLHATETLTLLVILKSL